MGTVSAGKKREAYAARYKATVFAANRRKKLERVIKEQPNNEQAKTALSDIHYRRQTPKSSMWSSSTKRVAQMLSEWSKRTESTDSQDLTAMLALKRMFSLKSRINGKIYVKRIAPDTIDVLDCIGVLDWNPSAVN